MRIFLSYAPSDKEAAGEIADRLSGAGYDVWYADGALFPGDNWALGIGKALERSDVMIVLLSPEATKAERVQQEVQYALLSSKYAHRVVPVLLRPTKGFPWILKSFEIVDASRDRERAWRKLAERLLGLEMVAAK
jgi:hypothetical protein